MGNSQVNLTLPTFYTAYVEFISLKLHALGLYFSCSSAISQLFIAKTITALEDDIIGEHKYGEKKNKPGDSCQSNALHFIAGGMFLYQQQALKEMNLCETSIHVLCSLTGTTLINNISVKVPELAREANLSSVVTGLHVFGCGRKAEGGNPGDRGENIQTARGEDQGRLQTQN